MTKSSEKVASAEKVDKLEKMTANEMAVDGYYLVAENAHQAGLEVRHTVAGLWAFRRDLGAHVYLHSA